MKSNKRPSNQKDTKLHRKESSIIYKVNQNNLNLTFSKFSSIKDAGHHNLQVNSLRWPDRQNGWMASGHGAFENTHLDGLVSREVVGLANTSIIVSRRAGQGLLRVQTEQRTATRRWVSQGRRSSRQDRGLVSRNLNHASRTSLKLRVAHCEGHHLTLSQVCPLLMEERIGKLYF